MDALSSSRLTRAVEQCWKSRNKLPMSTQETCTAAVQTCLDRSEKSQLAVLPCADGVVLSVDVDVVILKAEVGVHVHHLVEKGLKLVLPDFVC
jgi:hypothetical protein